MPTWFHVIACTTGTLTVGPTDPDEVPTDCTNEVEQHTPTEGSTHASPYDPVSVRLAEADPGASLTLSSPGGQVAGSSLLDDRVVTFVPDRPLDANTRYTASLTGTCAATDWSFTTGTTWVGATWQLAPLDAAAYEPAEIAFLLPWSLDAAVFVGIETETPDTLGVLTTSNAFQPDPCVPTRHFEVDRSEDTFHWSQERFEVQLGSDEIVLYDVLFTGTLDPVERRVTGSQFSAVLDLETYSGDGLSPGDQCAVVSAFGIECGPCPLGGDTCVPLMIEDSSFTSYPAPLVARSLDQIEADPTCPEPLPWACATGPRSGAPWLFVLLLGLRRRSTLR